MGKQVRIESDGTHRGTRVLVDDQPVNNCVRATWTLDMNDGPEPLARVVLELAKVPVSVAGDGTMLVKSLFTPAADDGAA